MIRDTRCHCGDPFCPNCGYPDMDDDPHYTVKSAKCKACKEMNRPCDTCSGSCGQCWSCGCDCPSKELKKND